LRGKMSNFKNGEGEFDDEMIDAIIDNLDKDHDG